MLTKPAKETLDLTIEHEMRTKTIPENGNYRVDKMAENGAPVVTVDGHEYEVAIMGGQRVEVGNFVSVQFDGKIARIINVV